MESRYGIGINNRYALFLDNEDGEEDLIVPKKLVEPVKAPPAPETKPVKKVDTADPKKDKPSNQNSRPAKDTGKPRNLEGE
jgi:hypothetical protein